MTDNEERERGARLVAFAKDRYGGVRQMAEQSDTPEKSLRRYCTGERSIPVEVLAVVVADGGSADWIVSGKGSMYADTKNLDQQPITIEWVREALREKLKAQAIFQEDQKEVATPVTAKPIGRSTGGLFYTLPCYYKPLEIGGVGTAIYELLLAFMNFMTALQPHSLHALHVSRRFDPHQRRRQPCA